MPALALKHIKFREPRNSDPRLSFRIRANLFGRAWNVHLITKFEYFCLTPDTKSCSRAKTLFSANAAAANGRPAAVEAAAVSKLSSLG